MPRKAKEMGALDVKRLQHPGRGRNVAVAVGGVDGLALQMTPTGARSWVLRTVVGGRRRELGLGGYPDVTLGQARERARAAKDAIRQGVDPVEKRKAARAVLVAARKRGLSFAEAVERTCATKLGEFRSDKHRAQWRTTLDTYAAPELGGMLVADIDVHDVLRVVEPLWASKTETASRLRGRIETVLAWATVSGHRKGDNPARWRGNLDALLSKPGKTAKVTNQPALALADAPAWFTALRRRDCTAARALELAALCACRSGEVRGMEWSEVDLDAKLWTIPTARTKAGREHRVPLSDAAVALLRAQPQFEGSPLVFTAPRGGMLVDMTLSAVMRRMQEVEEAAGRRGWLDPRTGRPAVPHGLRSTFRDWAAERGYDRDLSEIALGHTVGTEVERAYRRSDMLERRRAMATAWAQFLAGGEAANVVPLIRREGAAEG